MSASPAWRRPKARPCGDQTGSHRRRTADPSRRLTYFPEKSRNLARTCRIEPHILSHGAIAVAIAGKPSTPPAAPRAPTSVADETKEPKMSKLAGRIVFSSLMMAALPGGDAVAQSTNGDGG